jgi:hypothetical protein
MVHGGCHPHCIIYHGIHPKPDPEPAVA